MTYPTEPPRIPYRAGLGPAECVTCGAATLAAPGFTQPHCDACRRVAIGSSTSPSWLATLSTLQGRLTVSHHTAVERHIGGEDPPDVLSKVRILVPASAVGLPVTAWDDTSRVPRGAARLAREASAYGRRVLLTDATAEAVATGRRIESLCVRVYTAEGGRFGYASYIDGHASGAVLWRTEEGGVRRCGVEEFAALATGKRWTPPAPARRAECPACRREVRWTQEGLPYRHKDSSGETCWG